MRIGNINSFNSNQNFGGCFSIKKKQYRRKTDTSRNKYSSEKY